MDIKSFNQEVAYNDSRIVTKLILETSFTKEIRILLKRDQIMKEHTAPFPIIVHILEGEIEFGIQGKNLDLLKGSIITLDANIPHDLKARADSAVRLTLLKYDKAERVEKVVEDSIN